MLCCMAHNRLSMNYLTSVKTIASFSFQNTSSISCSTEILRYRLSNFTCIYDNKQRKLKDTAKNRRGNVALFSYSGQSHCALPIHNPANIPICHLNEVQKIYHSDRVREDPTQNKKKNKINHKVHTYLSEQKVPLL